MDAEREFSDWADTKASRVRVTVWGNVTCGDAWTKAPTAKGKEKAVPTDAESLGWRTLVQWDVDLNKAKPLDTHVSPFPREITAILSSDFTTGRRTYRQAPSKYLVV